MAHGYQFFVSSPHPPPLNICFPSLVLLWAPSTEGVLSKNIWTNKCIGGKREVVWDGALVVQNNVMLFNAPDKLY